MTNALIADRDRFAAAHPERRLRFGDRDWGYVDIGAGPVLLLIPGTLGRCDIFWQQIEALSGRVRVISTSYPASGGVADWGGDIVRLLDHLDIARATVLGSSLGGYLAQYIAGAAPERVDRLIAANTLASARGLDQRPPYSLDLETAPIADLRGGFGGGLEAWRGAHPEQGDLVDLLLMEVGGRIPEAELRSRLSALKTAPDLPAPEIPREKIFTVEAEDDPLIPGPMREAVRARLTPFVSYRFLTGGHFPYVARPDSYTAMLEQIMELDVTGPDWGQTTERAL